MGNERSSVKNGGWARDIKEQKVVLARRDEKGKLFIPKDDVFDNVQRLLDNIQLKLITQARDFRDKNTHIVKTMRILKVSLAREDLFAVGGMVIQKLRQKLNKIQKQLLDVSHLMKIPKN